MRAPKAPLPRTARLAIALTAVYLAVGLAVGNASCTSRTLPLPPPEVQALSAPDARGMVRVQGLAQAGASIGVVNDTTQSGTIVTTTGEDCERSCPFEAEVEAAAGDPLRVWQFFETERSVELVVPTR